MQAAKLPNEINNTIKEDYDNNTNKFILSEPLENEKYFIKISKTSSSILIESNQIHNPIINYRIELTLNEFYQLSKGFKMFDNLDEILDALQNIFISKKVSISKKAYSLLIILKINYIGGKEQEINIELNRNSVSKDIDDNIIKKLKLLEYKVNVQENEINNLKTELRIKNGKITYLEKALKEQKEEIKNRKDEYELELEQMQITKRNNITLNNKIDSKIINEIRELEFLENRLKNNEILKKKNITYKLLYRATRDGNKVKTFHNKCYNIIGTLSIIKTTKGMRFGGYTEKLWDSSISGTYKKDDKDICFCFSLDLFKIYNFKGDHSSSIYCHYNYGPCFCCNSCGTLFKIYNKYDSLFGYTDYKTNRGCFGKFEKDYEINGGSHDSSVVELEVFQILFDK